jgi:hypothetical protein
LKKNQQKHLHLSKTMQYYIQSKEKGDDPEQQKKGELVKFARAAFDKFRAEFEKR